MVMLWLLVAGCLVGLSSPLVAAQSSSAGSRERKLL